MKKKHTIRLIAGLLSVLLLAAAGYTGAAAADPIFINDGTGVFDGALRSAYAIGGGGAIDQVIPASELYVLTSAGLQTLSGEFVEEIIDESYGSTTVSIRTSTVKIGLKYYYSASRDSSVERMSLSNVVGSGFRFGYYDSNREFHEVGSTSERSLLLVKDTNVSVAGGTLGCYHIRLPETYSGFAEASAAAAAYYDGFPAYYNGSYSVLVGHYTSASAAASAAQDRGISGTAYTASGFCVTVVKPGTTQILFEFDGGSSNALGVEPIFAPAASFQSGLVRHDPAALSRAIMELYDEKAESRKAYT